MRRVIVTGLLVVVLACGGGEPNSPEASSDLLRLKAVPVELRLDPAETLGGTRESVRVLDFKEGQPSVFRPRVIELYDRNGTTLLPNDTRFYIWAQDFEQIEDGGWTATFLVTASSWDYGQKDGVFAYRVMTHHPEIYSDIVQVCVNMCP